jgi:hypothetical protein
MEKPGGGGGELGAGGLWGQQTVLLQPGDQLPPGARIISVTELEGQQSHRVSVLAGDCQLPRLMAGQPKPVLQTVLAATQQEQHQIRISLPQEVQPLPRPCHLPQVHQADFSRQLMSRVGPWDGSTSTVTSLQDSRLVGVPTMGRVIQMAELNRHSIPELKIVLENSMPELKIVPKLEDLDNLEIPISQTSHSLPLSSYIGKHTVSVTEVHSEKELHGMMLPHLAAPPLEPALIELVGQSVAHSLPALPSSPVTGGGAVRRVANRAFPAVMARELMASYRAGTRHDVVWRCEGGRYRVHRIVLALASPFLRQVLEGQPGAEGSMPVVHTPDIRSSTLQAILCLFYTGRANISNGMINEINEALKLLQFRHGCDILEAMKQEVVPEYDVTLEDFCDFEVEQMGDKVRSKSGPKQEEAGVQDSDDEWTINTAFDPEVPQDERDSDDDWWEAENKRSSKKRKTSHVNKNDRWSDEDEDARSYSGFKRGRKSLKTPDTHEMYRTRGAGKGDRSYQLAIDLFEGKHVDFIYVCHGCYQVFDTAKKLAMHKDDAHPDDPDKDGPCHTNCATEFNCLRCNEMVRVKHIAWFCKHYRYCRQNNAIANTLVGPEELENDGEENGKRKYNKRRESFEGPSVFLKDTDERLRITGEAKGKNLQTVSLILANRVVDYMWACKLCYTIHMTAEELEGHKRMYHDPKTDTRTVGKHWNPGNPGNYTCPHCEQVQNSRHIIWFIYHMRKCSSANAASIKKEINEEEDIEDEDEVDGDKHDPEQIVLKSLKVSSDPSSRSAWLSESLFGKLVERIYSCHICYSVYETEADLRHHFRQQHGDLPNRVRNGAHFDANTLAFNCPKCCNVVCKGHTNSVFFIYHMRRCSGSHRPDLTGTLHPIEKSCLDCGKKFSAYPAFKVHCDSHKTTRPHGTFMCHICTKVFPSNARLNYHVQYVHSDYKPFGCDKCPKAYKRKAELLEHEEMSHSANFNYACDKCGKQFYGKKNLALHMKTHYSDDEKKHVCGECGYRFAKIKFLKNHMTTHSDIRQYVCEVSNLSLFSDTRYYRLQLTCAGVQRPGEDPRHPKAAPKETAQPPDAGAKECGGVREHYGDPCGRYGTRGCRH